MGICRKKPLNKPNSLRGVESSDEDPVFLSLYPLNKPNSLRGVESIISGGEQHGEANSKQT